jgi:hypothetical protein
MNASIDGFLLRNKPILRDYETTRLLRIEVFHRAFSSPFLPQSATPNHSELRPYLM